MKRKNIQSANGISISDSIVMSVKQKHANLRKVYSAAIAIFGFISVIMAFLGMYGLHYNKKAVVLSGTILLAFYLTLSLIGGKAMWIYGASAIVFLFSAYKKISKLVIGYKFIYNIIYKVSFNSNVNYYKHLKAALELPTVTMFFIFYMWLLAIVICFFTVCRPNPVLPILITFPILEIGLYNGVKMPVFWGILCIAYWLAVMAMSTIDVGEYSGGQSGFVRKNNLFFPKRHMKLKVTEKCGMLVIGSVMLTALLSVSVLKLARYERSDSINQKRRDISDAVEDFSFNNFAESISRLSSAFGINFDYDSHKLGTNSRIRYKNVTDLTVNIEKPVSGAIYLKDYVGSVYENNQWDVLPSSAYNESIFDKFSKYGVYPQDFALNSYKMMSPDPTMNHMRVKTSSRKRKHVYVPYYSVNDGHTNYITDTVVLPSDQKAGDNEYDFCSDKIVENSYNLSLSQVGITRISFPLSSLSPDLADCCKMYGLVQEDEYVVLDCASIVEPNKILNDKNNIISVILREGYRDFAYKNYLDVPDTKDMEEVRKLFSDVVDNKNVSTFKYQLEVLDGIKNKLAATCTYSLDPGRTPSSKDFVNDFLLEKKNGFCTHFATSLVMLARMAGIPARYATGYVVVENDVKAGQKNADGSITVNVKDSRSHAWAEVYLEDIGWVPFECTPGYTSEEINIQPTQAAETTSETTTSAEQTTVSVSSSSAPSTTKLTTTQVTTSYVYVTPSDEDSVDYKFKLWLSKHSKAIKRILRSVIFVILVCAVILLRRYLILKIRKQKLSTGKISDRIINIYSYAEKLLDVMNMRSEMCNYVKFSSEVERYHGGIYFDKGDFQFLTDVTLRTKYSKTDPTSEEADKCLKTVEQISEKLYNKSDFWQKLRFKYINVLR